MDSPQKVNIAIEPAPQDYADDNIVFPDNIINSQTPDATITEPEFFVNSGSKWAQPGGKNTLVTITYSYSNLLNGNLPGGLSNAEITGIIREAVGLWSKYAPLNFVEVSDSGPAASDFSYNAESYPQIRFGTHFIDGSNNILAHTYYPYSTTDGLAGDIHLDSSETWKANPSDGIDLLELAVHELGHALGLKHESVQTAIMNPDYAGRYSGLGTAFIFEDDINGIQNIYGSTNLLNTQRWATGQGGFWDTQQWLSGDFNGDGKDDLANVFNDENLATIDVHPSSGSSFGIQRWATGQGGFWDAQKWLVGDFNGDGKDDLANVFNDENLASIDVHPSSGSSFGIQRWATGQGGFWDAQKWLVGDFNGDGKDDLAKVFNDENLASIDVHLSSGSGFGIQRWATDQGGFWDAQKWLVGDFNGDGKDDLAKVFNDANLATIDVHLSSGSGFGIQRWVTGQGGFWDAQQWLVGDFNGDGKDDLANVFNDANLATIDVHLSSGSGFGIERWVTGQGGFWDAQQWLVGDFNGDGKDDLAKAFNDGNLASIDVHTLI